MLMSHACNMLLSHACNFTCLLVLSGAGFVEDAILGMKQRSGATATVDAVKHVRDKVLGGPGSRLNDPDTATIVFVITDGKCNQLR